MKNFGDLQISETLLERLKEININTPTQIQNEVIKAFRNDLIVQSPTGTGKTLAYLIPIVEKILKEKKKKIAAIIIVPTRELAIQVADVLNMLKVENSVLIGGTEETKEFKTVLIATPGRFNRVLLNSRNTIFEGKTTLFTAFKKLDFLILDEADKLLSLGFRAQLNSITRQIKAERNALFSATFNDNISTLCKSFLKSPKFIKNEQKINLFITYLKTSPFMKIFLLHQIFKKYDKVIVFFLTCNEVEYFTKLFESFGYENIVKIHGKLDQSERNSVYSSFKNILFGTDLASRGIDFKNVDIVVHFDIPLDPDSFLHRSGRSARNNQKGKALLFVTENEEKYLNYLKIKNINISEESNDLQQIELPFIRADNSIENQILAEKDENELREPLNERINQELLNFSVKAFVSHIAAYKEHSLKFLLNFQSLDFDSLANLHFLEKIPKMKELGGVKFKNYAKNKDKQ